MRRRGLTIALALAALWVAPAADAAAPRISEVQSARFPERSWVLTLPERGELAAGAVEVRENGRRVEGLRLHAGGAAGAHTFGIVLAIDTSESMHGEAIRDAMAAARAFTRQRRSDQQIGILFFNRGRRVALPMTADGARIDRALAAVPPLSKGTRIYDAGMDALAMLQRARIRAGSVVILSDGADVGSVAAPAQLERLARRDRVRIFTVGLRSSSFRADALAGIAAGSRGAYAEASTGAQLERVYERLGAAFASEYLVTYRSRALAGGPVSVEATVHGFAGTATGDYLAPALPALPGPGATDPLWSRAEVALPAMLLVALLLGLATWMAGRVMRHSVTERIGEYVSTAAPAPTVAALVERRSLAESVLRHARWWPRFREQVELSGVGLTATQVAMLAIGVTTLLVWTFLALGRPIAAVILAFSPLLVLVAIGAVVDRRRRAFGDQLADTLQIVASAMRAGHSFEGGLAVAAEDSPEPMRGELRRVTADERLGLPLSDAMGNTARRMSCPEFDYVATVVTMQRQSGGNTAELLERTIETLRHRGDLRRLVRTLTAQGRAGGAIVTALPVFVALVLSAISPGYLQPMASHPVGLAFMVGAAALVAVGWIAIRKIVDIKV